jgi:hypothetical protein
MNKEIIIFTKYRLFNFDSRTADRNGQCILLTNAKQSENSVNLKILCASKIVHKIIFCSYQIQIKNKNANINLIYAKTP